MTTIEREELEQRFRALKAEEQKIAAMCLPDEVLLFEIGMRFRMVHLLTDKVYEARKVIRRIEAEED